MKKTLTAVLLSLSVAATAAAAVSEKVQESGKVKLSYPAVSLENRKAEAKINARIEKFIKEFKKASKKDANLVEANTSYELHYEDDNYLSFSIVPYSYWGGAHGMFYREGFVFDVKTGKQLQYTDFIPELSLKGMRKAMDQGIIAVLSARKDGDMPVTSATSASLEKVSENFVLHDAKTVDLLYQPYDLSSYSDGVTFFRITPETAEKINALK